MKVLSSVELGTLMVTEPLTREQFRQSLQEQLDALPEEERGPWMTEALLNAWARVQDYQADRWQMWVAGTGESLAAIMERGTLVTERSAAEEITRRRLVDQETIRQLQGALADITADRQELRRKLRHLERVASEGLGDPGLDLTRIPDIVLALREDLRSAQEDSGRENERRQRFEQKIAQWWSQDQWGEGKDVYDVVLEQIRKLMKKSGSEGASRR